MYQYNTSNKPFLHEFDQRAPSIVVFLQSCVSSSLLESGIERMLKEYNGKDCFSLNDFIENMSYKECED